MIQTMSTPPVSYDNRECVVRLKMDGSLGGGRVELFIELSGLLHLKVHRHDVVTVMWGRLSQVPY